VDSSCCQKWPECPESGNDAGVDVGVDQVLLADLVSEKAEQRNNRITDMHAHCIL
jgi:hypothetical protein